MSYVKEVCVGRRNKCKQTNRKCEEENCREIQREHENVVTVHVSVNEAAASISVPDVQLKNVIGETRQQ